MAETNVQGTPVPQAPEDDESKFKRMLKERYQIEEDPDTFRKKRDDWKRAEEQLPQYQATLQQTIQYIKEQEAARVSQPPPPAKDEEAELQELARVNPSEFTKRVINKFERTLEERFNQFGQQTAKMSEEAVMRREGLRRAHDVVQQQWPEAFDPNTELHKIGKQIYQQEMSDYEKNHPMAFLHATERAAGRLGLAPKMKRSSSSRSSQVAAQSASRDRVKGDDREQDEQLNPRQKQIAAQMNVDEKVYREALKNRRAQSKKQDEE